MKKSNIEPQIATYLHAKGRRLGLPIAGNFELTARCNFNCPMCYVHLSDEQVRQQGGELTAQQWLQIAREARDRGMVFAQTIKETVLAGVASMKGINQMLLSKTTDQERLAITNAISGMTDRIENPNSAADWIANDPRVVADHAGDMFNTFDTTIELVWDFCELYHFIESDEWAPMVPAKIPVYLIAGDQDPCGNYGEGLYHVANLLARTGNKTTTRAYTGYRHEIHNEPDRETVFADLLAFVQEKTKRV